MQELSYVSGSCWIYINQCHKDFTFNECLMQALNELQMLPVHSVRPCVFCLRIELLTTVLLMQQLQNS